MLQVTRRRTSTRWFLSVAVVIAFGLGLILWRDQQAKIAHYSLLAAISGRDAVKVSALLDEGAPVNARFGGDGETALHRAAATGDVPLVSLLLKRGANANVVDGQGRSPLLVAAYRGYSDVAKLLLDAGADPNAQETRFGMTPLQEAARKGHADVVQLLLDRHAEPKLAGTDGRTPAALAEAGGHKAIGNMLRRAEASYAR